MPPPLLKLAPLALLPEKVLLLIVTVPPRFKMPPPLLPGAVLVENVQLLTVSPPKNRKTPPPPVPDEPLAMVRFCKIRVAGVIPGPIPGLPKTLLRCRHHRG